MAYEFETKTVPTFYFIGVTTGSSSINKVFPLWMEVMGKPEVVLEGIDHAIHDEPENYRKSVAQIKDDPLSLGALVTTHKMNVYSAAKDMFDYFDPYAETTGELSCISKLDGQLRGHAKDPITAGLSLEAIIDPGYFGETGGHVLCLGAGGSAVATLLYLINKEDAGDRPEKFIAVNRSPGKLDHMREMVAKFDTDIQVEYVHNSDPSKNDELMAQLPDHSIVINATGMGKDTPGSPVTDAGVFPQNGIAWEFNYRGELDFLHQSLAQIESRNLKVEDGWIYFLHGWSQVIVEALHIDLTPELFEELDKAASTVRG
ncbi:MAG: shikimate dehydrogenase [Chloroflexi bacterium]|nr:MAG: shikimate dehydrogenase [Chloroflexota bacterium]MBL1195625.1 shikimate dehydrogenase [Chloroflexota bacterium]NOH12913.1 shikimate dehydrogenase [Chloroflexota bacterium]